MNGMRPFTGPGSQPDDEDGEFAFLEMPKGMRTYAIHTVPKKEAASALTDGLKTLESVLAALEQGPKPGQSIRVDLHGLSVADRGFVDEVLGEGDISVIAGPLIQVQESVLAGVWRIVEFDATGHVARDAIEVGEFPEAVLAVAQAETRADLRPLSPLIMSAPSDLMNAPALAAELAGKLATFNPGGAPHVINLSLLPVSDGDLDFLDQRLGQGPVTILSRGYGNCRISSTAVRNAWWVRYFNSRETLILNTLEVSRIPSVALAAPEDLEDSASRLKEILEVYR